MRKKRTKYPDYETKLDILLYLINNNRSRMEIITEIKETKKITERIIDKHLKELYDDEHIKKYSKGVGLPVYYHLNSDYKGFKKNFNLFNDNKKGMNFLNFQYAQKMITKDILRNIGLDIQHSIRPLRDIIFNIQNNIALEDIEKDIKENIKRNKDEIHFDIPEDNKKQILSFIKYIKSKPKLSELINDIAKDNSYERLMKLFYSYKENRNVKKIKNRIYDFLSQYGLEIHYLNEKHYPPSGYKTTPEIYIPIKEQNDIINILKTSPSALEFISKLNDLSINKLIYFSIPYLLYVNNHLTMIYESLKSIKNLSVIKPDKCIEIIEKKYSENMTIISPILFHLNGCLSKDIFNDEFIEHDWITDYYKSLFFPTGGIK